MELILILQVVSLVLTILMLIVQFSTERLKG